MPIASVNDLKCQGQRVLVRVDFNVPRSPEGTILDDRRIQAAMPTIRLILKQGGIPILISHMGRPAGAGYEAEFSLKSVADRLGELLGHHHPVHFAEGACRGADVELMVAGASEGDVVLLDNLRFEAGEKKNDSDFGAALAELADAYVNDAFGAAHRAHASIVATPEAMGVKPRVAGLLLERELHFLSEAIESPKRPFVAILGGAKVSDKLGAIEHLRSKVDTILVGGGMAYTFLQARGDDIGSSLCEAPMLEHARRILQASEGAEVMLPQDHVCAQEIATDATVRTCEVGVPDDWMGLDIGPETSEAWQAVVAHAGTVVWNGPVGVFEHPPFDQGTRAIANALAQATKRHHAVTIVGGGETAAAVELAGVADRMSHVSTGGGASLKMLEGGHLPGIASLEQG